MTPTQPTSEQLTGSSQPAPVVDTKKLADEQRERDAAIIAEHRKGQLPPAKDQTVEDRLRALEDKVFGKPKQPEGLPDAPANPATAAVAPQPTSAPANPATAAVAPQPTSEPPDAA